MSHDMIAFYMCIYRKKLTIQTLVLFLYRNSEVDFGGAMILEDRSQGWKSIIHTPKVGGNTTPKSNGIISQSGPPTNYNISTGMSCWYLVNRL